MNKSLPDMTKPLAELQLPSYRGARGRNKVFYVVNSIQPDGIKHQQEFATLQSALESEKTDRIIWKVNKRRLTTTGRWKRTRVREIKRSY